MRLVIFILITFSFNQAYCLSDFSGTWQGLVIPAGKSKEKGFMIYLDLAQDGTMVSGKSREEIYNTEQYALKLLKGSVENNILFIEQKVVQKSSKSRGTKWCRFKADLTFNEKDGYLRGSYESTDCKRVIGEIILYRSDFKLSTDDKSHASHIWFTKFISDLKEGLPAPEIRKRERDNFVFEPVFFDFDKSTIRSEHHAFLDRLIKVVKGHTDLRVRVIGHTDADGSNYYNDVLSKKRAEAIIEYFVNHGLSSDRLEFDFKGENSPIDTNSTPEGKQRNRRVDFEFI